MYALFEGGKQIGRAFATEKEVWEAALIDGLVIDEQVPDAEDRIVAGRYRVMKLPSTDKPRGDGQHRPYACKR